MDKSKTRKQVAKIATLIVFAKVIQTSKKKKKQKKANTSKIFFSTKSTLFSYRKSRSKHQEDKTVQRGRPSVSQTRRQQGNKKIRLQFLKKNEPIRI